MRSLMPSGAKSKRWLLIRRTLKTVSYTHLDVYKRQQHNIVELERTANAERKTLQALINNRDAELAAVAEHLLG